MKTMRRIQTFHDQYPWIGPTAWMLSVQYYIVQLLAALAWARPYSLSQNTISDLGVISCGVYSDQPICSPLHNLMNTSFMMLGVFMIVGSVLIYHEFKKSFGSAVGFSFMAVAGVGTVLVGLFPEDTVSTLHIIGAALPFLIGNLALVVFAVVLDVPKIMRYYTLLSGLIALSALLLFLSSNYLGIGPGGMERFTAYPQTIWLIVFGFYISSNHVLILRKKH